MRFSVRVGFLALVGVLVPLHTAHAQPAPATCSASGQSAKGAGDQAMLANRHAEALACYEAAYRYAPSPALLYNQARALEFLQLNAEALRRLLQFERSASTETQQRVPQLPQLIASLKSRVGELELICPVDGANVQLDDSPAGLTPLPEVLFVDPGTVRIQVRAEGYRSHASSLQIEAGEHRVVRVVLDPIEETIEDTAAVPVSPAPPPPVTTPVPAKPSDAPAPREASVADGTPPAGAEQTDPLRVAAWSSLGVGAAAAVFAGVSFGLAVSYRSDVCGGPSQCTTDDYDPNALDSYDSWRGIYTGSLVVAGVGLLTGGALFWLSTDSEQTADGESPQLGVTVAPGALLVTGQF